MATTTLPLVISDENVMHQMTQIKQTQEPMPLETAETVEQRQPEQLGKEIQEESQDDQDEYYVRVTTNSRKNLILHP